MSKPSITYLEGQWKNKPHNIELQSETGRIILNYSATSINIVAGGTLFAVGRVSIDNFKNLNGHTLPLSPLPSPGERLWE
jgi:hypothetical protein